MNRRDFLHLLGIGAVSVAAPRIIFDMGKNSRIYAPEYEAYKLYKVDDRFGIYQPDGSWFFGPGIMKLQILQVTIDSSQLFEQRIVASTSAKYPQGAILKLS